MSARASMSLERKLPLLISVLLVLLAVALTWAGYEEVRHSAELRGIDRLQRVSVQVAEIVGAAVDQRFALLRRVAAHPAIVSRMAEPGADAGADQAAIAALKGLVASPTDTPVVAELRIVGETRRIATHPELPDAEEPLASLIVRLSRGRPAVGELYRRGDSVFFWAGAPVMADSSVLGYVLQRRTFRTSPTAERRLRGLIGDDNISAYFASDRGDVWTSFAGTAVEPPAVGAEEGDAPNVTRYARADSARYVAVYARVANTPLRVLAEVPEAALLERSRRFLRRSIAVALVMLGVGSLAAWLLSRHITRPLRDLTVAATAISAGDYSKRADVHRSDETGRLADAFNAMADQVQRSYADLEQQIATTRSLAGRLEEANRTKADFLATMSHELRTPLNAIAGYVDLLEMGVRGPLTAEQRHDLERVRHNQRHLLTLIANILDFTRLDAQKLRYHLDDVHVGSTVTDVLTAIDPLLEEKRLYRDCVGCDQPLVARADRDRLEQILLNLLSNAARFTPPGGAVIITTERRNHMIAIVVADTGIGIPEDKLGAIFEPFVQLDRGLTRTVGGTGLGLTISRELARAMGGDLTAESGVNGGARFTLTLPAVGAEAVELPSELAGRGAGV